VEAGVYKTLFKNQIFQPLGFEGIINRDTMDFSVNATNFNELLDDLNINGEFSFKDDFFQITFLPSDLVILANKWTIDPNNYIRFGDGFVETKNFYLYSLEKRIAIESMGDRGLSATIENIDLSIIDDYWDFSKLDFGGSVNITASAEDVFKLEGLHATAVADTLEINGDDWGLLRLDADMETRDYPIDVFMNISKGQEQLTAKGFVGPFTKILPRLIEKDYLFNVIINNYPLSIAEYFIENGLSGTIGTFDADIKLDGLFKGRPNINGTLNTHDLALTIDYLQTRYRMAEGQAKISNSLFDVSGNYITDKDGNKATLLGGIRHDHLSAFTLDVSISSDEFLFLDTELENNPLYYGTAYADGYVKFTGPFNRTDIFIDATTRRNSTLYIPVNYIQDASEVTFIKYRDKKALTEEEERNRKISELRGVSVELFLDITPEAQVYIIFDEQAGDKIRGRGEGSINLKVPRFGTIEMIGDYIIEDGEYLFTLFNNIVNKPFKVKRGGTINWSGDPLNADINLEAIYTTRTALSALLSEYFDGASTVDLETLARKSTQVDLLMFLTGKLLSPEINFDINFPNAPNELRSFVESKMNILRFNQNELNRQVFGLMVVGSFLPSGNDALNGRAGNSISNTLSEMVSSQLSIYMSGLLSEVFTDVGFISGIDFDINYSRYSSDEVSIIGEDPSFRTGNELEVRLNNQLFNDRLSVNVGGNVDWGDSNNPGQPNQGAFLAGDLVLEYVLTKDKRFKVRFYQRSDQNFDGGRRNKTGLGFSYRREFDNFGDFVSNMKKAARGVIE
jgi:hypothetical protein